MATYGVAVSPNGDTYVAVSTGAVWRIEAGSTTVDAAPIEIGGRPTAIAIDRSGQYAYVTDVESAAVWRIDLSTRNVSGPIGIP